MTATATQPDRPLSSFRTVRETAERLALTPWSVYQMISAGILPVHRTGPRGRTIRIAEEDLLEYQRRVRTEARHG